MVQLTLPKNSQLTEGTVWPKPAGTNHLTEYKIYRWNPDDGKNPTSTPIMSTATIAGRWCWTG